MIALAWVLLIILSFGTIVSFWYQKEPLSLLIATVINVATLVFLVLFIAGVGY